MKKYKLYVKKSNLPRSGLGLFTGAFIKKGAFITEYAGEVIDWKTGEKRMQSGKGAYIVNMPDKILDAMNTPDVLARYANDAEGPGKVKGLKNNAELFPRKNKKCFIRAGRDIQENEEIFYPYGKEYWQVQKEVKAKLRKKKLAKDKLAKEKLEKKQRVTNKLVKNKTPIKKRTTVKKNSK